MIRRYYYFQPLFITFSTCYVLHTRGRYFCNDSRNTSKHFELSFHVIRVILLVIDVIGKRVILIGVLIEICFYQNMNALDFCKQ